MAENKDPQYYVDEIQALALDGESKPIGTWAQEFLNATKGDLDSENFHQFLAGASMVGILLEEATLGLAFSAQKNCDEDFADAALVVLTSLTQTINEVMRILIAIAAEGPLEQAMFDNIINGL